MSEPAVVQIPIAARPTPRLWALLRDYGIVFSVLLLATVLAVSSSEFLTGSNLRNLLEQSGTLGIVACGATFVIISGGFDLSVGAIYALAGVIAAKFAISADPLLGLLAGALAGAGLGIFNGALVAIGRINAFVATLASSFAIRGLAVVITSGFLVTVSASGFTDLGQGSLLTIKTSVWVFLAFAAVSAFVLSRTTFGAYVYAVGGNPEAAQLAGVRVNRVRIAAFGVGGLAAGLAGVIVASRIGTGQADTGVGIELSAIAAVTIGGTSIMGGEGAIWRTVLGVLLLSLISNGFTLLNVDPTYQQIIQGGIIVAAVGLDAWSRRR